MKCRSCGSESRRVRIVGGVEQCHHCGDYSESGGVRIDSILSRQRVRDQAAKFEGDTLNPWQYNKLTRKPEPNPDFIKLHGKNARNFYNPEQVKKGYPGLAKRIERQRKRIADGPPVLAEGSTKQAFTEVIK